MVDRQTLRFRRHLAVCVIVVLAVESPLGAKQWLREWQTRKRSDDFLNYTQRYTRIRLASAASATLEQQQKEEQRFDNETLLRYRRDGADQREYLDQVYNYNYSDENNGLINEVFTLIGSYLPVIDLNYTFLSPDREFEGQQLDKEVDDYYAEIFKPNSTLDEFQLLAIKAANRFAPMPLHTAWGYKMRQQMLLGSLPVKNEQLCRVQLAHLNKRLDTAVAKGGALQQHQQAQTGAEPALGGGISSPVANFEARQIYLSTDLDLWRLMDTFGKVGSDLLRGNIRWVGSYSGCLDTRLDPSPSESAEIQQLQQHQWWLRRQTGNSLHNRRLQNKLARATHIDDRQTIYHGNSMRFRYCIGALKSRNWDSFSGTHDKLAGSFGSSRTSFGGGTRPSGNDALNAVPIDYRVDEPNNAKAATEQANYFIRIGICLPEACDSSAIEPTASSFSSSSSDPLATATALSDISSNKLDAYGLSARYSIERLVKFNLAKPFDSDHYYLSGLYCLPDNRSPLRRIPFPGKLLLLSMVLWLALIGSATLVHLNVERFYKKTVEKIRLKQQQQHRKPNRTSGHDVDDADVDLDDTTINERSSLDDNVHESSDNSDTIHEKDFLHMRHNWIRFNVYIWDKSRHIVPGIDLIACLSLYSNWLRYTHRCKLAIAKLYAKEQQREQERLRNEELVKRARPRSTKAMAQNDKTENGETIVSVYSNCQQSVGGLVTQKSKNTFTVSGHHQQQSTNRIVDTSSLNALKVVALIWIIAGHCVFYMGSVVSDGAIVKNYLRTLPSFALANGAMYITELFFVITGCLTAYLTFKQNSIIISTDQDKVLLNENFTPGACQNSTDLVQMRLLKRASDADDDSNDKKKKKYSKANINQGIVTIVKLKKQLFSGFFWLLLIVHRYLRIVPTYLLIYALVKLVTVYIGGEGPLWDYAVSPASTRLACSQESWLPVLTLTTNFGDVYKHCIVGGWYLSTDMQFAIVSAPLLLILALCQRRPRPSKTDNKNKSKISNDANQVSTESESFTKNQQLTIMTGLASNGSNINIDSISYNQDSTLIAVANKKLSHAYGIIAALGVLSAIVSILYGIWQQQVDLRYIIKFSPHSIAILTRMVTLYTNSLFRFRAFAFGMILGHKLYMYEFRLIKLPKFIQLHGSKLMVAIFILGFGTMFAPVIYPKDKILISHEVTSIMAIVSAGALDVFLCIMIFLICIKKAPKMVLFILNSPFWSLLSTLSLSAFLIHAEIVIILSSQLDPPPSTSYSLLFFLFAATIILTYMLALALYLSFELPVSRLIESLMKKYIYSMTNDKEIVQKPETDIRTD